MKFPLVSIITPSYNQGKFIEETILSVKNQEYPNIEHIIIDGGSTDNTVDVLKRHECTYNMHWLSEPDRGQADAINKGFKMAHGEIISWINSDDVYFDITVISSVVKVFLRKPEIYIVYGDITYINEDNTILMVRCVPSIFNYRRLLLGCFLEQPAVFMRRNVIEKHKLDITLQYGLDYEYWLRITREFRPYHFKKILAGDRNHPNRKMISGFYCLVEESKKIRAKYGQFDTPLYKIARFVDRILTGIPRRTKGFLKFFLLYRKSDFAFHAKFDSIWKSIKRQLFTTSFRNL